MIAAHSKWFFILRIKGLGILPHTPKKKLMIYFIVR